MSGSTNVDFPPFPAPSSSWLNTSFSAAFTTAPHRKRRGWRRGNGRRRGYIGVGTPQKVIQKPTGLYQAPKDFTKPRQTRQTSARLYKAPTLVPTLSLGPQIDAPSCTGVPRRSFEHAVLDNGTTMPPKPTLTPLGQRRNSILPLPEVSGNHLAVTL